jgi:hypothetical protein
MPMTLVEYLIFVKNDGILVVLVENGFFYNRVHTKHVEALKGNQYKGFKIIPVNASARKSRIIYLDAKIPVNLLIRTPFQNIITIKSIPPNPKRRSSKTFRRCYSSSCATCSTLF